RVDVVRVHLDGEFVLREDKFHENGEFLAGSQQSTAPVWGHCTPRFAQTFSGERAGSDFAIDAGEPGLTARLGAIGFFGVKGRKGARSPEARAEDWLDAYRLGSHGIQGRIRR